ncbi:MAG: helix-hairpin-helix domain-containing protein, partial [Phycisphaerae bacterium]
PLVARAEQVVLVVLALAVVAGVAWRIADTYRLGADPLETVPPSEGPNFQVNVNSADWVTLSLVPGLGRGLASAIVEARTKHDGQRFDSLDDLLKVDGIGEKTLAKLRPYLFVGDSAGDEEPIRMLGAP